VFDDLVSSGFNAISQRRDSLCDNDSFGSGAGIDEHAAHQIQSVFGLAGNLRWTRF
jgi:hypothetical protein